MQQNRSPFVNIYFCLPLFLFSKSQKCCINVTAQATLTHCQASLMRLNLSLSIFPLYLCIVKGPSGLYGYTFGWGCYPLYLQHKKFTLAPIPNSHGSIHISTGGVLTIYIQKKDLWENNDLIRSHELFQYISQMLLVKFHFRCLYIYERVFRQVYSCRYGSNIKI